MQDMLDMSDMYMYVQIYILTCPDMSWWGSHEVKSFVPAIVIDVLWNSVR